ncbi:selenide, water dikinase SelD [Bdellovibrio sp. HCB185ZH]|uniref:selenide, water dikinase SelD n=1 Tax=Bdellovibrio sp. HCB185ZH TaxID=3394235 RepID=UPI0039A4532D
METNSSLPIQLTQTVKKGGCAAKVAAHELRAILDQVKFPPTDEAVMVDGGLFDDAAIYKVSDNLALVQTLDFFTPIVDSPKLFGAIASANALSDVYAMGGTPKTAMAIFAFPLATMENKIAVEILQGASDKMAEADVNFVGGHSIDDDTLKFGLSVTGFINPQQVWSNAKAKAGDFLILTKALGTGTCMASLKRQAHTEKDLQEPLNSMATLNRVLDLLDEKDTNAIHAATDVTGFGLIGHSQQMALASQKTFTFNFSSLPLFELTMSCLEQGFLTKAHASNAHYTNEHCQLSELNQLQKHVVCDPQTSGGLLLSVSADQAPMILTKLKARFPKAAIVGKVSEPSNFAVEVKA